MQLPLWIEIVIAASAVVTAVWILWTKAIQPTTHALMLVEKITPYLEYLTITFPDEMSFQGWINDTMEQRHEMRVRLARIEQIIDYEHPPPRDWNWRNAFTNDRERRKYDQGHPPDDSHDRRWHDPSVVENRRRRKEQE